MTMMMMMMRRRYITMGSGGGRRKLCTSTAAMEEKEQPTPTPTPTPTPSLPLYRRLSALGATGESVSNAMNQYVREGKTASKLQILSCVRQLRKYNRFQHALELIEWMEKRGTNLSYRDHAVLLDLLSKTKGILSAEQYFNSLQAPAKSQFTYGALLNCYCKYKMTEKALALFEKMSELNFLSTLSYNNVMSLYMSLDEPEKVPVLVQKMEEKGIPLDTFTYNVLMNAHAATKNIEGAERVLKRMEIIDSDKCNWTTYSNLAVIYIRAGLFEKAESALTEVEKRSKSRELEAYHYLISLYAGTSNLSEVHRVWNTLKSVFPKTNNLSYLVMLQALAKLDDFDGLVNCFEEWQSSCSSYDMRLVNTVISAHLRKDMFKESELLCEDAIKRGARPNFKTQELFMDYFMRNGQWDLVFSCMEISISKAERNEWEWKPNQERKVAFLKHFEEEKDVNGAEKFCNLLKKVDCLDSHAYRLLLSTYVVANKKDPGMRRRLEADKVEVSSEIEELLKRLCA